MVSMNYQNENEVVPNFTEEISGRSRNVSQCSSISSINNYTLAQSQMHRTCIFSSINIINGIYSRNGG